MSHRLDEIFRLTDCVSVLKNGELVGTVPTAGMTRDGLISMMTDNWVSKAPVKAGSGKGEAILEAEREGLIILRRYGEMTDRKKEWIAATIREEYTSAADHPEYRHFLRGCFLEILKEEKT